MIGRQSELQFFKGSTSDTYVRPMLKMIALFNGNDGLYNEEYGFITSVNIYGLNREFTVFFNTACG